MNNLFKKRMATFLTAAILIFPLLQMNTPKVEADTLQSTALNANVVAWVMNDTGSHIYAVTDATSNNVLFIRTDDLTIEDQLTIGSAPSDITLDQGKLYIPQSAISQVSVVDAVYGGVVDTVPTDGSRSPYRLAVDGEQLFYVEETNFSYIYEIDMTTDTETQIDVYPNQYSRPDLAIDKSADVIYVGESGTSGGDLAAYDTTSLTRVDISDYNKGYGFSYPSRKLIIDGNDVFYAGRKLDKSDLATIHGDYQNDIVYVKGNYVIVNDTLDGAAIHDRNTYVNVAELPFSTDFILMDDAGQVYAFNPDTQAIEKMTVDFITTDGVYSLDDNKLVLDRELDDLVYSEATGQVLAISTDTNKLLYINGSDMTVENEIFIGSQPTDLDLVNNELYVALWGASKIAVTDEVYSGTITEIDLGVNPYRIETGTDDIYFLPEYSGSGGRYLYRYDRLTDATEEVTYSNVPYNTYYQADLYLDTANDALYLGESSLSSSDLLKVEPDVDPDYTVTELSTGYSYPRFDPGRGGSLLR